MCTVCAIGPSASLGSPEVKGCLRPLDYNDRSSPCPASRCEWQRSGEQGLEGCVHDNCLTTQTWHQDHLGQPPPLHQRREGWSQNLRLHLWVEGRTRPELEKWHCLGCVESGVHDAPRSPTPCAKDQYQRHITTRPHCQSWESCDLTLPHWRTLWIPRQCLQERNDTIQRHCPI